MTVRSADEQTEGRSARKRRAIMEAALAAFLEKGYERTSMDEIAAAAAVSKQTVYKHFANKERLFTDIVVDSISAADAESIELVEALTDSEDLEADLRRFARKHLTVVLQPHVVQMRRVIISEARRFPDGARTWYEHGPQLSQETLAAVFKQLEARGLLRFDDAELAAAHFNWLILSIPLNQAMFFPGGPRPRRRDLDRYADEGVRIFLAAYGT